MVLVLLLLQEPWKITHLEETSHGETGDDGGAERPYPEEDHGGVECAAAQLAVLVVHLVVLVVWVEQSPEGEEHPCPVQGGRRGEEEHDPAGEAKVGWSGIGREG